jgi:hypothetical protein
VAVDVRAASRADLDEGGELAVRRSALRVGRRVPTGERSGWWLAFRAEGSRYDADDGALGLADPPRSAGESTLLAAYEDRGRARQWFAAASLLSGLEEGARESESLRLKGAAGVLWRAGEGLYLGVGAVARTHLEDDPSVFPFPLVEWRIDERSRLGVVRSADPGLGYSVRASEGLELYLALVWEERQYRLDDDPGPADAALTDEELALRLGAIVRRPSGLEAELFVGASRRALVLDADGHEAASDDVDPAALLGVSVGWRF